MICPYPTMSEKIELVSMSLATAQMEIGPLAKEGKGVHGAFLTFELLRETVLPILGNHGLAVTQIMLPWPGEPFKMMKSELKKEVRGKDTTYTQFQVEIATVGLFRTLCLHKSGQWLASDWPIMAEWGKPQEVGAIVGHFKRYALETLLGIAKEMPPPPGRRDDRRDDRYEERRPSNSADGARSVPATSGQSAAPAEAARPLIPAVGDPVDYPSDDSPSPGSSGEALRAWLYDRGGCGEPRVAIALMAHARGQHWPENVGEWSADQASRGYAYAWKKLGQIREKDKEPRRNGFKELVGMTVASGDFDEFKHTNGD
jgi:ERF superfamily